MIDTFELATAGQLNTNTFTLASNGVLIEIEVDVIPIIPDEERQGGGAGFGPSRRTRKTYKKKFKTDRKYVKRIKATVKIDGVYYTDVKYATEDTNINVNDVYVVIDKDQDKPKVTIKF